jgi:hypothetical protein
MRERAAGGRIPNTGIFSFRSAEAGQQSLISRQCSNPGFESSYWFLIASFRCLAQDSAEVRLPCAEFSLW